MADEATKAHLRTKFDKLTADDFKEVAGNKEALATKVAEKYGISKEEATKQVEEVDLSNPSPPIETAVASPPKGEDGKKKSFEMLHAVPTRSWIGSS
ncbi:uncharacterized protein Z519_11699 [Cladophialophora bantiana CBS 173.52]|uniref:Uncharacterized protein n=1 Tax=Cladophialophora bantiana (strain ATCC 10958 / CBS 173.52 / CDC B-1940 / NIH 8579) TaxID=1442370 RepID=A0A0D2H9Z3_CLAB1|nr:uncharacterized protein Z519_11699 [Cladophialophora bantiana CBS 173.52]KIW87725.1 hypothetical protein Z519_11699 [Cladophialophora bantiana CBS 173.52]